ncbi:phosphopantothenoylcysteine decarboxylase isoform X2 [Chiroxiphia lanceolata]|uniref:phosphopantothenoylcysteine decarboxylase isoform X2 n=1 Tax=Chiroxiphia lanceolata TaxID=296741 RepID=UPI0013CEEC20|nr:phosphopantothenoylcysteine decarboxylase isoform X2 [Chiroxiphia lanceolata]
MGSDITWSCHLRGPQTLPSPQHAFYAPSSSEFCCPLLLPKPCHEPESPLNNFLSSLKPPHVRALGEIPGVGATAAPRGTKPSRGAAKPPNLGLRGGPWGQDGEHEGRSGGRHDTRSARRQSAPFPGGPRAGRAALRPRCRRRSRPLRPELGGCRPPVVPDRARPAFAEFDWSMEPVPPLEPGIPAGKNSPVPQKKFRVLVGVTGSVAALKLPLLVVELLKIPGLEVKVVTTERAKHFYDAQEIPVTLYGDEDEWQLWKGRSDPVLHIELRRWADLMVVAPLDANTLAKVANGICDNLLTCVIRAWDLSKPLLFCPAMNTAMWEHPITARQVEQLKGFGYTEIPCVVKKLVCGDEGRGAMAEVWTILERVKRIIEELDVPRQS